MILFDLDLWLSLIILQMWLTFKLTLNFNSFFIEAGFVGATLQAAKSRILAAFTESFDSFTCVHFFYSLCLEQFALEWVSWLRSLFKNFNCNSLILEVVVFNLLPVDLGVFRDGCVNDSELGVIAHLFHFPLNEAFVVVGEGGLTERVGFGHLEYLTEQELVLFGQH